MPAIPLYGGEVMLEFDPKRHRYTVNGQPCQGVTAILSVINKPALAPWMVKQACEYITRNLYPGVALDEVAIKRLVEGARRAHREISAEAADVGKIAHKFSEEWGKSNIRDDVVRPAMPVNQQAKAACEAFLGWWGTNRVEPQWCERVVYSRRHNYAGTVDAIAIINGRLFVADFKTSSALYDEMRFQLSAYKLALVEEGVVPADAGRMVLRFAKDGSGFHVHELPAEDDERDRECFLAALTLSRHLNILKAQKEAA